MFSAYIQLHPFQIPSNTSWPWGNSPRSHLRRNFAPGFRPRVLLHANSNHWLGRSFSYNNEATPKVHDINKRSFIDTRTRRSNILSVHRPRPSLDHGRGTVNNLNYWKKLFHQSIYMQDSSKQQQQHQSSHQESSTNHRFLNAKFWLIAVAVVMGSKIPALKILENHVYIGSLAMTLRYSVSLLVLAPITLNALASKSNTQTVSSIQDNKEWRWAHVLPPMDAMAGACLVGVFCFIGDAAQALALLRCEACKTSFIASLDVVVVAVLSFLISPFLHSNLEAKNNNRPKSHLVWISLITCLVGIFFIEVDPSASFSAWSLSLSSVSTNAAMTAAVATVGASFQDKALPFIQPLAFGAALILNQHVASKHSTHVLPLLFIETIAITTLSALWTLYDYCEATLAPLSKTLTASIPSVQPSCEVDSVVCSAASSPSASSSLDLIQSTLVPSLPTFSQLIHDPVILAVLVYSAAVTTALAPLLEAKALSTGIKANEAAVILSTEPAFACVFGSLFLGEQLGPGTLAGATCLFASVILSSRAHSLHS